MLWELLAAWLCFAGVVSGALTVADKLCARQGRRRVPEKALFLWAALGGSAVMYLTMRLIRHKTRHRRFMWGLPCLFALQCAGLWALWRLTGA